MKDDLANLIKILREIRYVLNSKQRRTCFIILLMIIFGAVLDTLGVSLVLPFVQALLDPGILTENYIVSGIFTIFDIHTNRQIIISTGLALCALYVFKNLYLMYLAYKRVDFRWSMQCALSGKMLDTYMSRPYSFFLDINSSTVIRGVVNDINSFYSLLDALFLCVSDGLTLVMIMSFLFVSNVELGIAVFGIGTVTFVLVSLGFRRLLKGVGVEQREADGERYMYAYQAVNGIKEIDVMQRKAFFVDKFNGANNKVRRAYTRYSTYNAFPPRVIEAICVSGIIISVCAISGTGGANVQFVSSMAVFVAAAFRILPLIANLTSTVNQFVYFWPGVDATYNNIVEAEQYEKKHADYVTRELGSVDHNSLDFPDGILEIKEISWKYPMSDRNVLDNLNLIIHRNESVGIIGNSGAGKTTLSDIIMGLYRPQKGSVEIDGVDIFAISDRWSKMIGYVPQVVFLTDDTVRANVTFGLYENEIDDDRVWKALEMAQLKEFVLTLPDGINTRVGERGVKFSGGQKQRIAIARALYYNPDILVLDEATSALDNETEKAVMESIDSLLGKKTLIIIAHRLSTIKNCDSVYEIVDGKAIKRENV